MENFRISIFFSVHFLLKGSERDILLTNGNEYTLKINYDRLLQ